MPVPACARYPRILPISTVHHEAARRIMRDGNRASEIIARLRTLFSKKEATAESVELNEAAREVVALCFG